MLPRGDEILSEVRSQLLTLLSRRVLDAETGVQVGQAVELLHLVEREWDTGSATLRTFNDCIEAAQREILDSTSQSDWVDGAPTASFVTALDTLPRERASLSFKAEHDRHSSLLASAEMALLGLTDCDARNELLRVLSAGAVVGVADIHLPDLLRGVK